MLIMFGCVGLERAVVRDVVHVDVAEVLQSSSHYLPKFRVVVEEY